MRRTPVHFTAEKAEREITRLRTLHEGLCTPTFPLEGDGSRLEMALREGAVVEVLRNLGTGSYGSVQLVSVGEIQVAKKVSLDPETGFANEMKMHIIAARVEGVVPLLMNLDGEPIFPFAERGSLARIVDRRGASTISREQLRGAARGLAGMHALGLVHRDVKMQNILVFADGTLKISDLGAAMQVEPDKEYRIRMAGSPLTMAPEVVREEPLNDEGLRKTDVFSFGVVLYNVATGGYYPFQRQDGRIEELPYMFAVAGGATTPNLERFTDPSLRELVGRMLSRDPALRPTMAEVLEHPYFSDGGAGPA